MHSNCLRQTGMGGRSHTDCTQTQWVDSAGGMTYFERFSELPRQDKWWARLWDPCGRRTSPQLHAAPPVILGQLRSQIAPGEQEMDQHGPAKDSWVLVPIPEA